MKESRILIVKDQLLPRVPDLVRKLFGSDAEERHHRGGKWMVRNPRRNDRHVGSFVIWTHGAAAGAWKDYAAGDKGDVLDLIAFVECCDRKAALAWAEDYLGIRNMSAEERKQADRAARQREAERIRDAERRAKKDRDRARRLFYSAQEQIRGTQAETYLAGRGIDLGSTNYLAHSFRFKPDMEWWEGAERDEAGKKIRRGPLFPALISAMADHQGRISACHLTFLAHDGSGKAPVAKPKLMWPATSGLVVRVSRGLGDERCALALTEGVEDALSVAIAAPHLRVWAAGSLAGLGQVPDHPKVRGFLVFRDNDWDKPQAVQEFDRAIVRLEGFGKPVVVLASPEGKDVNDLLNGDDDE